jgi:outer membrane protein
VKNRESLPENIRARREQELMDSQQKIREYLESCQYNKDMKEAQLMDAINAKVLKAIQAVGEEGSYVCIFNLAGGVVPFVSSTLTTDVTEAVKAKLGMK